MRGPERGITSLVGTQHSGRTDELAVRSATHGGSMTSGRRWTLGLFAAYGVLATTVGIAFIGGVYHARAETLWAVGGFALAATAGSVLVLHVLLHRLDEARRREHAALEELSESEERFRSAFRDAPTGMALLDLRGTLLAVNPTFCEMLRRRPDELTGRDFRAVVAPEFHDENERWARQALAGDPDPLDIHEDLVAAGGQRVRVHATGTVLRSADGGPLGFVSQVVDLSDLRAAEQQADENARFAHAVLDSLATETAVVSRDGKVTAVNAAWERALMTGDGRDLVIGVGGDYLAMCDRAARRGERAASEIAGAVRHVLEDGDVVRRVPYEIGEGAIQRSFVLTVTPLASGGGAVLSHVDETWRVETQRQLRVRAEQQAVVARLGQHGLTLPDVRSLLGSAISAITETLRVPYGDVLELETAPRRFRLRAAAGWGHDEIDHLEMPLDLRSAQVQAIVTSQPVVTDEVDADGPSVGAVHQDLGVRSHVAVPIPVRDGIFGVLEVSTDELRQFNVDDLHFLESVASLLGAAIAREGSERRGREADARMQAELEASEERFRLLAENAGDIVFLRRLHPEPRFEFMSPSTERTLGYPPERWYENPEFSLQLVHPDDAERFRSHRSDTGNQRFSFRARHADGSWRWLEMHSTSIRDEDGRVVAVQGIVRDIDSIMSLGDKLQERIAQQATLAELGIQALDAPPDDVLSGAVARVSQTLQTDLVSVLELLPDGDGFRLRAGNGFPEIGSAVIPAGDRSLGGYTLQQRHPVIVHDLDQETRFDPAPPLREVGARSCLAAVIPGSDGPIGVMGAFATEPGAFTSSDADFLQSVAALVGAVLDAERERAARAATEEQLQLLAQNALDVVYRIGVSDPEGFDFQYVSPAVTEVTGYTPEELYADPSLAVTIIHPDDRRQLADIYGRGTPATVDLRFRLIRRDGRTIWVEQRARNLYEDGELVAIEGIVRDATEQVEAEMALGEYALELQDAHEELLRATRLRDDFLALTSHELRTPMTPIMGFLDILQKRWDTTPDEKKREYLAVMDRQARRLYHLVSDLLVMSQVSAGTLLGSPTSVDVPALLVRVLDAYPGTSDDVQLEVVPGARAYADPKHLEKIIGNFLSNAFKYGGAPVTIRIEGSGDHVEVRVCDRGAGVREEAIPTLFDRFTQGDEGDRRTVTGTGLGLAVCRELATLNAGEVWYEARPGGGACFVVRLPAEAPPA